MGYALAEAARDAGAQVTLISAPTGLPPVYQITIAVRTAEDMHRAVMERLSQTDVLIMAAAVADYRPVQQATQKIKKAEGGLVLRLERTQDILAAVTRPGRIRLSRRIRPRHPGLVVGFAAETENLLERAEDKLRRKKPDLLVANDVSSSNSIEVENNRVTLLTPDGQQESFTFDEQVRGRRAGAGTGCGPVESHASCRIEVLMMKPNLAPGSLTDVLGVEVGHATNHVALTGCTVVLCRQGAIAGGSVRGLAPGTRRRTSFLAGDARGEGPRHPAYWRKRLRPHRDHGVMRYLEEQGIGFDTGMTRVPIVPGAVLYDLALGDASVRTDGAMGYSACQVASAHEGRQGNIGAGTGATVGKLLGHHWAMKAGLGTASMRAGRLVVAALVAVNAFGDVVDPASGAIVAGARTAANDGFVNTSPCAAR